MHSRHGIFHYADDGIAARCVCIPCDLDLHILCMESDADVPVHLLSDFVGTDGCRARGMLLLCHADDEAEARRSIKHMIYGGTFGFRRCVYPSLFF